MTTLSHPSGATCVATTSTLDGNEAAASVAHRLSDVIVLYPISPSTPMGEACDEWSAQGKTNLWDQVPDIVEMQSEGGAIGAVHGTLQAGALTTTFTASQGLLLMLPNLFKIAGELTPFVVHVAARTIATHALSIFGDHSDIYAARTTGFAQLSSNNPQEVHDFALIATASTLDTRVPFMHFFDGFRTSHEVGKIGMLGDEDLRALIDESAVAAHRARRLTPDAPVLRGTAQNPDTFFQAREAINPFYHAVPDAVQRRFDQLAKRTGRPYQLFEYVGDPDADRVIIMMGSGCDTAHETVEYLNAQGEKVGLIKVRLFRPFSIKHLMEAIPSSVSKIAVLDRTKEPGAVGDPLYLDVMTALHESGRPMPTLVAGRYGLSSKEFNPAMVKAVFDNLSLDVPRNHFTVGITDDVTHTSLKVDSDFTTETDDVVRAVFFGLGSDGTVGANKNSIKIIGDYTDQFAQGFFVYDSKKAGAVTISHLRFGHKPIRSTYLINQASFVACHQFNFIRTQPDLLDRLAPGGTLLLNAPYAPDQVWAQLPKPVQAELIEKRATLYTINADRVARDAGMGGRINTVMQTCFFALSGVLQRDQAIAAIKQAIEKTYARKGDKIVAMNFAAVDATLEHLHEVTISDQVNSTLLFPLTVPEDAPDFVQRVTAAMMAGHGDGLPVSAFPVDGTWPTGTTRYEKRSIAHEVPIWDEALCIQCNKCALVCPHAAIRAKVFEAEACAEAPKGFVSVDYKAPDLRGKRYTLQVAPEDCTGCNLCVNICPAKDKSDPTLKAINMKPLAEHLDAERSKFEFFETLGPLPRDQVQRLDAKGSQWLLPLFEYSGACAGCGETPYIKLLTQLFGDRALMANATGCSSIYGGNLPTTPYCTDAQGRGPAWANSLFEDNAEFGFGMRLALDARKHEARDLLMKIAPEDGLAILEADQSSEAGIQAQRQRIEQLKTRLRNLNGQATPQSCRLAALADDLVQKSVWLVGGDGWAYDIGYGGLDHVLAQDRDINILVLDTEVYSNTGGQASKSTPLGAVAKFAAAGKETGKKDLGLMAMSYGHVYVASIAMGANDNQTVKALREAESYPGPSLIIAYSHCIAHGYDMGDGLDQQKAAVASGIWPLYRYDPRLLDQGKAALQLDAKKFNGSVLDYMRYESRFRMVEKADPARFAKLAQRAQQATQRRIQTYQHMSELRMKQPES